MIDLVCPTHTQTHTLTRTQSRTLLKDAVVKSVSSVCGALKFHASILIHELQMKVVTPDRVQNTEPVRGLHFLAQSVHSFHSIVTWNEGL